MAQQSPLLTYWLQAAQSPCGLGLRSPDPLRLKGILYTARSKAPEAVRGAIAHLQLRTSPVDVEHELWIVPGEAA